MSYTLIGTHVAAAAIAAALAWGFEGARHDAAVGEIRVDQAEAQLRAVTQAQAKANANTARLTKALNDARNRQQPLARAAAAAERRAAGLQQLLDQADVRIATATREAVAQYAAAANRVFRACVERYRQLGKAADGHADDVRTFDEGWPDQ